MSLLIKYNLIEENSLKMEFKLKYPHTMSLIIQENADLDVQTDLINYFIN